MWRAAILVIVMVFLARGRAVRAMSQSDQDDHLGYGYLSGIGSVLVDALAIVAGIAVLIVIFR